MYIIDYSRLCPFQILIIHGQLNYTIILHISDMRMKFSLVLRFSDLSFSCQKESELAITVMIFATRYSTEVNNFGEI